MNALAQEQLQRQAESIPLLKREIEREVTTNRSNSATAVNGPASGRKNAAAARRLLLFRECQKWAWPVPQQHCYAPGEERPPRPARKPVPRPKKADVVREEQVDLTDKALRVFFLEGCTDIDAATEKCRRALPATFERAFVTGATGSTVVLEAPDKKLLEREDVLTFMSPFCRRRSLLPTGKFIVPLSEQHTLPEVKLDDAVPVAFAALRLGAAVKAILPTTRTEARWYW